MATLHGRTIFMSGRSRGIGLAIALDRARDGANIVIAAKTAKTNPRLLGTMFTAADAIVRAGGQALPIACDIRDEAAVVAAVAAAVTRCGGIDILANNASAISHRHGRHANAALRSHGRRRRARYLSVFAGVPAASAAVRQRGPPPA